MKTVKAVVDGVKLEVPEDVAQELIKSFKKESALETERYYKELFGSFCTDDRFKKLILEKLQVNLSSYPHPTITTFTPPGNTEWFLTVTHTLSLFVQHLEKSLKYRLVYPSIKSVNSITVTFQK